MRLDDGHEPRGDAYADQDTTRGEAGKSWRQREDHEAECGKRHQHGLNPPGSVGIKRDPERQLSERIRRKQKSREHAELACGQPELNCQHRTHDGHHGPRGLIHEIGRSQRYGDPGQHLR